MIDTLALALLMYSNAPNPEAHREQAAVMARRLDDAGLLDEERHCAVIGCTENARMGMLCCAAHEGLE